MVAANQPEQVPLDDIHAVYMRVKQHLGPYLADLFLDENDNHVTAIQTGAIRALLEATVTILRPNLPPSLVAEVAIIAAEYTLHAIKLAERTRRGEA